MAWQDTLEPASYAGIPFHTASAQSVHGRDLVLHDYPFRAPAFAEDMGRATREYTVVGFLVGDDYRARLDALIAVAETEGTYTLVHPWRGTLRVRLQRLRISEALDDGRVARLEFDLIEASESAPLVLNLEIDTFVTYGVALVDTVADYYSKTLDDSSYWISSVTEDRLFDALQTTVATLQGFASAIDGVASLCEAIEELGLDDLVSGFSGILESIRAADALKRLIASLSTPETTGGNAAAYAKVNVNEALIYASLRQVTIAHYASVVTTDTYVATNDVALAIQGVNAVVDSELATVTDTLVAIALQDLRTYTLGALRAKSVDLAELVTLDFATARSSLEIAQDLYGDAERALEIEQRNVTDHPGFMFGTLQALNK